MPDSLLTPFMLQKGTRQGCPLSLLLFKIEPLVRSYASPDLFRGFMVGHSKLQLVLFIDAIIILLCDPRDQVPCLLAHINLFGFFSVVSINLNKSKYMFLVRNPSKIDADWAIQFSVRL